MGDSCESGEWELGFLQPKQTPGTTRWPPWLRQTTGVVGNTWRKQTFTESSSVRTWHETKVGGTKKGQDNKCIYKTAWCVIFLCLVSWWMSHGDSEHTTQWVELMSRANSLTDLSFSSTWLEFLDNLIYCCTGRTVLKTVNKLYQWSAWLLL